MFALRLTAHVILELRRSFLRGRSRFWNTVVATCALAALAGICFGLFGPFTLLATKEGREASKEKSSDYALENLDDSCRGTDSIDGGGGSCSSAPPVRIELEKEVFFTALELHWLNTSTPNMPADPRSFWGADPSPPAIQLSIF